VHSAGPINQVRAQSPFFWINPATGVVSQEINSPWAGMSNVDGAMSANGDGLFIRVPCDRIKDFVVSAATEKGNSGRYVIVARDAAGANLSGTITDSTGIETYVKFGGVISTTNYGNAYTLPVDGPQRLEISCREEVKFIDIGVCGASAACILKAITVQGIAQYNSATGLTNDSLALVYPFFGSSQEKIASANPATAGNTGYYEKGESVINSVVATGQPLGWKCSIAGFLGRAYANSLTVSGTGYCHGGRKCIQSGNSWYNRSDWHGA
jgi:hypothetical protein